MKYSEAVSIYLRPAGVWLIEFADNEKRILVVDRGMPVTEVVDTVKAHDLRDFTVMQIWVGEFVVSSIDHSYAPDGRRVSRDLEVSI